MTSGLSLTRGCVRVGRIAARTPESCDTHVRETAIADRLSAAKKNSEQTRWPAAKEKGVSKEQDGCIGLSDAACVSERIRILHGEHRALASTSWPGGRIVS